jgi:hypothetical protein
MNGQILFLPRHVIQPALLLSSTMQCSWCAWHACSSKYKRQVARATRLRWSVKSWSVENDMAVRSRNGLLPCDWRICLFFLSPILELRFQSHLCGFLRASHSLQLKSAYRHAQTQSLRFRSELGLRCE